MKSDITVDLETVVAADNAASRSDDPIARPDAIDPRLASVEKTLNEIP